MPPTKLAIYVEADPSHLGLARAILEREGFALEGSDDPERALAAIRGRRPEVTLVDLDLPGIGGLGLIRALRATREGADLPIVALSASTRRGEAGQALAAGADAFVAKPYAIDALSQALAAAAEARRSG